MSCEHEEDVAFNALLCPFNLLAIIITIITIAMVSFFFSLFDYLIKFSFFSFSLPQFATIWRTTSNLDCLHRL